MNENILIKTDGSRPTVSSLQIAEHFGKQHKNVVKKISELGCSPEFTRLNFQPSEYTDSTGRRFLMYELTRDGFTFLVMGFIGPKAIEWKEKYIAAFNELERRTQSAALAAIPNAGFLAALQSLQLQNQNFQEQGLLILQGLGQIQELALAADEKADTALAKITEFETEREAFQARLDSFDAPTVEAPEETPRAKIQKIVSGISRLTGRDHRRVFGELYYDFRLRYHIDLPARAKAFKHKTTIEFAEAAGYIDDLYSMAYATLQKLKANAN